MKSIFLAAVVAVFFITACNRGVKSADNSGADSTMNRNTGKGTAGVSVVNASFKKLLGDYFKLKNALTADEANLAAEAGQAIVVDFDHFDQSKLSAAQKKTYTEIAADAREMAEHIGKSADRMPHQREHFDMLSKDMYDMVKLFGAGQPVYVDHCPMYNNRKGAIWLSEIKSIKNPYLGKSMPDCGSLKEELK